MDILTLHEITKTYKVKNIKKNKGKTYKKNLYEEKRSIKKRDKYNKDMSDKGNSCKKDLFEDTNRYKNVDCIMFHWSWNVVFMDFLGRMARGNPH